MSIHDAAVPVHRAACSAPATYAHPTCWPSCTPEASEYTAASGWRSIHEPAVPLHRLAWGWPPTNARPTWWPASMPHTSDADAPAGWRLVMVHCAPASDAGMIAAIKMAADKPAPWVQIAPRMLHPSLFPA